jgi:DNA-binding cell septation regulator SpoVG
MNITKVEYNTEKTNNKENYLANVAITLDYNLVVHDIKLMTGSKGEYLIFPTDYQNRFVANPMNEDTRQYILKEVLNGYYSEVSSIDIGEVNE